MKIATDHFPKSDNAWGILGEAFELKGDKKTAILNFNKSLGLNPSQNVRANTEKYLKLFGAL